MKKLIYGSLFLAIVGIGIVGCKKENLSTFQNTDNSLNNTLKSSSIVDEYNVGVYHNQSIMYIIEDLSSYTASDVIIRINDAEYISGKLNEYCISVGINLPNKQLINESFNRYENNSLSNLLSNNTFSVFQKQVLKDCFDKLVIVNNDYSKANELITYLNMQINFLENQNNKPGKRISIAIINQLISSTQLWIIDGKIDFLYDLGVYEKVNKPTPGEVLGADGKGLGTALLFGGWTSPIGWAGSLFVGAGASFGKVIGSNWWPY